MSSSLITVLIYGIELAPKEIGALAKHLGLSPEHVRDVFEMSRDEESDLEFYSKKNSLSMASILKRLSPARRNDRKRFHMDGLLNKTDFGWDINQWHKLGFCAGIRVAAHGDPFEDDLVKWCQPGRDARARKLYAEHLAPLFRDAGIRQRPRLRMLQYTA